MSQTNVKEFFYKLFTTFSEIAVSGQVPQPTVWVPHYFQISWESDFQWFKDYEISVFLLEPNENLQIHRFGTFASLVMEAQIHGQICFCSSLRVL